MAHVEERLEKDSFVAADILVIVFETVQKASFITSAFESDLGIRQAFISPAARVQTFLHELCYLAVDLFDPCT